MPGRGAKFRAVAITVTAVVVVLVFVAGALTWWVNSSGPAVRVVSEEGSVSVAVPADWEVDELHPTDPAHQEFLNGRERAALGLLQRGGFWVARWAAGDGTNAETIKARMRKDQRKAGRGNWSLGDDFVAGQPAVVLRYDKPPESLEFLGLGKVRMTVRELVASGFVYQVGTWTLPHAGNVPERLEEIAQSLEIFKPQPWRAAHLTMPGGWIERKSPLPGATFHALSPGDPAHAWAYVFRYPDSPADSLAAALRNIPKNGGAIESQQETTLKGRAAVRLEFKFPDLEDALAHGTEWFFDDGRGGTFVLAVGHRTGEATIADELAATWRFK